MRLWPYLREKMQNAPSQEICESGAKMTFEEMLIFVERFSEKLKGIKCCAVLCQSEMATSIALLSCFAAEVTALPLSQRYGELHCNRILDTISPDAVITDQDGEFQIISITDSKYTESDINPALIMCTSGTSGVPKGVMLTDDNIIANIKDIEAYFKIGRSDTILISRPLYHCAVLTGEFLISLVKGANIRFYSGSFNPAVLLKMLNEYNITVFCGTPTLLHMMARMKRTVDKETLQKICISGECMDKKSAAYISEKFPHSDIYHVYGLTEAGPRVSYLPPSLFKEYADFVGIPLKSISIKVVTKEGKIAETNEVGLLWVKGENIMKGYYNDPARTAEVLKDGWLCTGDLALINEVGLLKIKGRNDDLIIKAGMNIYPQEIECAIKQDQRVADVYVCSEIDEKQGVQIVINIAGDFENVDEVKMLCVACLPSYQVPAKIRLFDKLPKNASGKIVRR